MATSTTRRSTPKLSEVARHVVVPAGVVSTGWPAVEAKCSELGIRFRLWQVLVGRLILAKRSSGRYAATVGGTGLSIPRQVGKTFLVAAIVFALCLLRPGLTVIWTAHRLRTAEETFGKMQAFARRAKIAPHVAKVVLGSGEEEVRFRNGSRILFGARERGFGRGFDEVDVLIYDEAQILTEAALDDMVPATNQSRQDTSALLLFMGTPPKPSDPGEVFTRMRDEALSGEDDDTAWVEFGADEAYEPPLPPEPLGEADWRQVARANPSYPEDTPREAILRMRKKLGHESFLREGLGIWGVGGTRGQVVSEVSWEALADPASSIAERLVFAVDVPWDGQSATVVAAGRRSDGAWHVEVAERLPGTAWVVDWLVERVPKHGAHTVAVDGKGAVVGLLPGLVDAGLPVRVVQQGQMQRACQTFVRAVREGHVHHLGEELLAAAVGAGRKGRRTGDLWSWAPAAGEDISALVAATAALWAAQEPEPETEKPRTNRAVFV